MNDSAIDFAAGAMTHSYDFALMFFSAINTKLGTQHMTYKAPHNFDAVHWEFGFIKSPVPTAIISIDLTIDYVNEAFCALVGHSRADLESQTLAKFTPYEDGKAHDKMIAKLVSGEQERYTFQTRLLTKEGGLILVGLHVDFVSTDNGLFLYVHALPLEAGNKLSTATTKSHDGSTKSWLITQIKTNWIAILTIIVTTLLYLAGTFLEFNKTKWELQRLAKELERIESKK